MTEREEQHNNCLNCGHELHGENYCPNCGQKTGTKRLTLSHFIQESLTSLLSFDSRFYRTLWEIFRYPGKVAKEYNKGRRMAYLPPFRLYFLASIIMLFVNNGGLEPTDLTKKDTTPTETVGEDLVDDEAEGPPGAQEVELSLSPEANDFVDNMVEMIKCCPELTAKKALDSLNMETNFTNLFIYEQLQKGFKMDKDEFFDYFASKLFWVFFLFIPLFALVPQLLYIRRNIYYLEHLVFILYTQGAFFIVFTVVSIVEHFVDLGWPTLITIFAFPLYTYLAMLRFYGQSRRKTFLKWILLNTGYFLSAFTFLLLSLFVSFLLV